MPIYTTASILAAAAAFNAQPVELPDATITQIGNQVCRSMVIPKPERAGVLAGLESLGYHNSQLVMQKLGWDINKEAPPWAVQETQSAGSLVESFSDWAERQRVIHAASLDLHRLTEKDGKLQVSERPSAHVRSWLTQDGKPSASFPHLKSYFMHIEKCSVSEGK